MTSASPPGFGRAPKSSPTAEVSPAPAATSARRPGTRLASGAAVDLTPALELLPVVGRTTAIYFAVLLLLRLGGHKKLGKLTPMDIMTMMLLSHTVSDAMTAGDHSVAAGLVAATTVLLLTATLDWLTYRFRGAERVADGQAEVLIRDGEVDEAVMASHRLTPANLSVVLHEHGLLGPDQVRMAFVEATGVITVVPRERAEAA